MNTWSDYKKTMFTEIDIYELARNGDIEAFKGLNLNQEQINVKNHKGYSPLMLAAYNGHYRLAEYLLFNGADANSIDHGGNSILMGVAFKGNVEIAALLLSAGAHVEYTNAKKQTALIMAKMFGRSEMVMFLQSYQNKPEAFSFLDILKSWSSVFNFKGAHK